MGSGAWPQKNFVECLHADDTYQLQCIYCNGYKFAVRTGLDRLVPKLKLQKQLLAKFGQESGTANACGCRASFKSGTAFAVSRSMVAAPMIHVPLKQR
jgi:hypothetical protein